MILPFSTQLNGKPTHFVERIWKGLLKQNFNLMAYNRFRTDASINGVINQWDYPDQVHPKLHTIREDKNDRWKAGTKIDFFINCRQKDMFRFAPVLPVVSVQDVEFTSLDETHYCIKIDGRFLSEIEINQLAINDGFDSTLDFLNYFQFPFKGKIIHWTDLKY